MTDHLVGVNGIVQIDPNEVLGIERDEGAVTGASVLLWPGRWRIALRAGSGGSGGGGPVTWADITGKPTSFPPSGHRHDASEIDNLPTGSGGSTAWADITGKPSTFPPEVEGTQDIVGAMVAGAGGTYDDAAGTITLPSGGGSGLPVQHVTLTDDLAQATTGWPTDQVVTVVYTQGGAGGHTVTLSGITTAEGADVTIGTDAGSTSTAVFLHDGQGWTCQGAWVTRAGTPPAADIPVTATEPTWTDDAINGGGTWTNPTVTGVTYSPASGTATPGQSITVTATAQSGYSLSGASSWSHTFPQAPASGWAPTELGALLAWFDAADEATITAASGNVSQWNDKSGNDRHASSVGASQPTTGQHTVGSQNALRFHASVMSFTLPTQAQPVTLLAAYRPLYATDGRLISTGMSYQVLVGPNLYAGNAFIPAEGQGGATLGVTQVVTLVANGASSSVRRNGSVVGAGDPGSNGLGGTTYIGAKDATGINGMSADLCEVIMVAGVLTPEQLADAEAYLTTKWQA